MIHGFEEQEDAMILILRMLRMCAKKLKNPAVYL
jgi:hypothetical protein